MIIRNPERKSVVLVISATMLVTSIGYASFHNVISSAESGNRGLIEGEQAVCYIGNIYYTSIEKALSVAGDDKIETHIYVIPGANPTIKKACQVPEGDFLHLPYDDNKDQNIHNCLSENYLNKSTFADAIGSNKDPDSNINTNRKSLVTIAPNVILKNYGTIEVGGELAANQNQSPSGMTCGSYSEILMSEYAEIQNYGNLYVQGYIKETYSNNGSKITNYNESNFKMPFVIYDFKGGTYSTACALNNVMPFSVFDFPNVHSYLNFEYGSVFSTTAILYVKGIKTANTQIIAPNTNPNQTLFKMSNGDIGFKYTPISSKYSTNDINYNISTNGFNSTNIDINSSINISSISLSLGGVNINTSKYEIPISYKMHIKLLSGTSSITNKIKFLMGSSLEVGENATLKISNSTSFYQDYVPNIFARYYPTGVNPAKLIVNGTAEISSPFGGFIDNNAGKGIVRTVSGFSNSYDVEELLSSNGLSSTKDTHREEAKLNTARVFYKTENGIVTESYDIAYKKETIKSNETYNACKTISNEYGWISSGIDYKAYEIKIECNSDTAINNNGIRYFYNDGGNTSIDFLSNTDPDCSFDGFYYDSSFTNKLDIGEDGRYYVSSSRGMEYLGADKFITIYAKWVKGYTFVRKFLKFSSDHLSAPIDYNDSVLINVSDITSTYNFNADNLIVSSSFYFVYNNSNSFSCYVKTIDAIKLTHKDVAGNIISENYINFSDLSSISTSNLNIGDTLELSISYIEEFKTQTLSINGSDSIAINASQDYTLTGFDQSWFTDRKISLVGSWSYSYSKNGNKDAKISITNETVTSITIKNNNEKNEAIGTCSLSYKIMFNGEPLSSVNKEISVQSNGNCVIYDTLILLSNGEYRRAVDLKCGDEVIVFDHLSGKFSKSVIAFNDIDEEDFYNIIYLEFDNGVEIKIATEHGFFDVDLNKYVYITENNYRQFVGHNFMVYDKGNVRSSKLIDSYLINEFVGVCSPGTTRNFNIICENIVTLPGGIEGLFNYFELDKNHKIDIKLMKKDIEKYGLYKYEEFKEYMSYEAFIAFNVCYAKVSFGKGILNERMIYKLLKTYKKFLK